MAAESNLPRRLVVTGASGFIGGHLTARLAETGAGGCLLSRKQPSRVPTGFAWQKWQAGRTVRLDGAGADACALHLATVHHVERPDALALAAFHEVNVQGTRQLLADCAAAGIRRFIFFSSIKAAAAVHGTAAQTEADPVGELPNSDYGRSKLAAEQCVREWAAADASRAAIILRPSVVYGPGNTANLFAVVDAIARGRFFFAGRNDNIKSLVAVRNVVAAVEHLAARMQPGVELFYLVDRESFSVQEIAAMIARALGRDSGIRSLPVPLLRAGAVAGDVVERMTGMKSPLTSRRLAALLEETHFTSAKLVGTGFTHPVTTEAGLAEMVAWYRAGGPHRS
ncbi:MAG: NAD-dependent epimerase/dehydratase family protein [Verrucomicrobia bacterium]|nr:NAD-dependent epimerase/dehydratase family protein [Verrucomicrobiota bacterium]